MTQAERDLLEKAKKKLITQKEAADELGVTERHVRRLLRQLKRRGDKVVAHALRGLPSNRKISADTEQEAVRLANGTAYGLSAGLQTKDLSRAHRVAAALRAGTVWVNCFFIRDLRAPFGGVGDSGVGREGGNFSREFFTEPKAVVMQIDMEG